MRITWQNEIHSFLSQSTACLWVEVFHHVSCSIMKLICSVWHIPIQMLIACRQQMRWHTVIIITDKLEIFIFCRQCPASLTFQLFSWDCPVHDQYSSYPVEDWALCSESFFFFPGLLVLPSLQNHHHSETEPYSQIWCVSGGSVFLELLCHSIASNAFPFFMLCESYCFA